MQQQRLLLPLVVPVLLALVLAPVVAAHDDGTLHVYDPSQPLLEHDSMTADVVSSGPTGKKIKNLALKGRGERLTANATTDVWAHKGFAYTGTFNSPCGGEPGAGVWVWNVQNKNKPSLVSIIESESGSRSNDVKVATMNSGDILVHSNETCGAGGMGGFEVYNVDDPANPVHLATVRVHEANETLRTVFGGVNRGVHNLFLFTQGERDLVALQTHAWFGGFQIFEITDPTNPELVTEWGAELLCEETYCSTDPYNETDVDTLIDHINGFMFCLLTPCFGQSQNRFLHDITVTSDGNLAYLSHWDAGLILLDISDPANPVHISTALDPENGSLDGEVNSHSAWPSKDGKIVVEGEEDFAPFTSIFEITTGPDAGQYGAAEGAITVPIVTLPDQEMAGPTVYVGLACEGDSAASPGAQTPVPEAPTSEHIALIQRGECTFSLKINNAEAAGYAGVVVFNSAAGGDGLLTMGGDAVNLPGVFVGRSTGFLVAAVADASELTIGAAGESIRAAAEPNAWGGLRIWDYSDPANPVLASTFNTVCSANPVDPSCDPAGTYSVHNVIVESTGKQVKAYVSWYYDGMLILDVSDPYNPREIGRYFDNSAEFLASNGGEPHDFWGVGKEPNSPWVYGSDRNGGLYVFKEQGSGSGR